MARRPKPSDLFPPGVVPRTEVTLNLGPFTNSIRAQLQAQGFMFNPLVIKAFEEEVKAAEYLRARDRLSEEDMHSILGRIIEDINRSVTFDPSLIQKSEPPLDRRLS